MYNTCNTYIHTISLSLSHTHTLSHYLNKLFIDLVSINCHCMKKSCILLQRMIQCSMAKQQHFWNDMMMGKRLHKPYFLLADLFLFLIFPRGSRQSQASGSFPHEHSHHAFNSRTQKHGWDRWKRLRIRSIPSDSARNSRGAAENWSALRRCQRRCWDLWRLTAFNVNIAWGRLAC